MYEEATIKMNAKICAVNRKGELFYYAGKDSICFRVKLETYQDNQKRIKLFDCVCHQKKSPRLFESIVGQRFSISENVMLEGNIILSDIQVGAKLFTDVGIVVNKMLPAEKNAEAFREYKYGENRSGVNRSQVKFERRGMNDDYQDGMQDVEIIDLDENDIFLKRKE